MPKYGHIDWNNCHGVIDGIAVITIIIVPLKRIAYPFIIFLRNQVALI